MGDFVSFLGNNLVDFWGYTGFANATPGHLFMLLIGLFFIYLAVAKEFEPMLLIPIGFGILIGNIPFNMEAGLKVGIYEEGSVLNILYQGVTSGWYPPLIFLGIGASLDERKMAVGPSAPPMIPIAPAWLGSNPMSRAMIYAPKIPNCAAAPISINLGLEISAEKSVMAPIPRKMSGGYQPEVTP